VLLVEPLDRLFAQRQRLQHDQPQQGHRGDREDQVQAQPLVDATRPAFGRQQVESGRQSGDGDMQRAAATALRYRAGVLRAGLELLTEHFNAQQLLLSQAIDQNASAMSALIDRLTTTMNQRERDAQARFDAALGRQVLIASRIEKLAEVTPARYVAFDLLAVGGLIEADEAFLDDVGGIADIALREDAIPRLDMQPFQSAG